MIFIAKPRYQTNADGTVTDLAPAGARMNESVFLTHIELASDTDGVVVGTDADELLASPLITDKMYLVELAEALIADGGAV